jgi:hypothetical protein
MWVIFLKSPTITRAFVSQGSHILTQVLKAAKFSIHSTAHRHLLDSLDTRTAVM